MSKDRSSKSHSVHVWDLATRLFHWSLVIIVSSLIISAKTNNNVIHSYIGYAALTLLLFRISWGFIGSDSSRFALFIKGPNEALNYIKSLFKEATTPYAGHNPVGGLMVVFLITLLAVSAVTGLFADDGCVTLAPLGHLVTLQTSEILTLIHESCLIVLLVLVMLHVSAAFFYLIVKRQNLIFSLITGKKVFRDNAQLKEPKQANPLLAFVILTISGAFVWAVITLA